MKVTKLLGFLILIIQLVSAVALILSLHTMLGVFVTAISSENQNIEIQFGDPTIIPFKLTPINKGYLEATINVNVSLFVEGIEAASDSALDVLPPNSMIPIDLKLELPLSEAEKYLSENVDLQWKMNISVTTLYNMVSFSNNLVIEGGSN